MSQEGFLKKLLMCKYQPVFNVEEVLEFYFLR